MGCSDISTKEDIKLSDFCNILGIVGVNALCVIILILCNSCYDQIMPHRNNLIYFISIKSSNVCKYAVIDPNVDPFKMLLCCQIELRIRCVRYIFVW